LVNTKKPLHLEEACNSVLSGCITDFSKGASRTGIKDFDKV